MTRIVLIFGALFAIYSAACLWRGTAYSYSILWAVLAILMFLLYGSMQ